MAEAGWYPDPQDPRSLQYFDGRNWTGTRRPASDALQRDPAARPTTQNPKWAQTQPHWAPSEPARQPQWVQDQGGVPDPRREQDSQRTQQHPRQQPPPAASWGPGVGSGWGAPAAPAPTPPPPPPVARRRRTGPLVLAGVLVAAVVAVLAVVLLRGGDDAPSLTYQGKAIANADATLSSAEAGVAALVSRRHGVSDGDTRCYFVRPDQPDSGQKKTDVQSSLRCGPVLFVDGNPASEYVAVTLSSTTDGSKATLTAQPLAADVTPARLDTGVTLVRPDGKTPPDGTGGLSAPAPQQAAKDVVTVASPVGTTVPGTLSGAVMVGLTTKVSVPAAGYVTRYGSGDDARSAPSGQRLIAFRVSYGPGEGDSTAAARAMLVVDGTKRALPTPSGDQWIVAAVGTGSTPVLQLVDGGLSQTLSLPNGRPGTGNAQVPLRQHTSVALDQQFAVPVKVTNSGGSATVVLTARASSASLTFWAPGHEAVHASAGNKAILSVRLNYTEPGNNNGPFGFDPPLLRVRLPSGQLVAARNIATEANRVFNVFEVPADFTTGRLEVTGSEKIGTARVTVSGTRGFTVSFAAG